MRELWNGESCSVIEEGVTAVVAEERERFRVLPWIFQVCILTSNWPLTSNFAFRISLPGSRAGLAFECTRLFASWRN